MTLYAISDLHVSFERNRQLVQAVRPHPSDWLIVAGDVGETTRDLALTLDVLAARFARVIWTPGNHELWTRRSEPELRGQRKYEALLEICRERGVLTPEDEYATFDGLEGSLRIAPLFLLYDYSFGPSGLTPAESAQWAMDGGVLCTDEVVLAPDPFPSRSAWCQARCDATERRLAELVGTERRPLVLVNHFPLLAEHAHVPQLPGLAVWCGTRRTRDWHVRYRASVVVYGHMHLRGTRAVDGVRFEEVSLGYPSQWDSGGELDHFLRVIAR